VSEFDELGDRLMVVFDGHCGFCNGSVRWVLRRDRLDRLRFVASESPKVTGLLLRQGISAVDSPAGPGSILAVHNPDGPSEEVLERSAALIAILAALPGPWPAVALVLRCVPRPLRDFGYGIVARWRYRIWGRLDSCPLPTPAERARFL
jgi:predicted DCC family thiol-disulfide oxidoreductase YuxK